jgi:hypothetical protein
MPSTNQTIQSGSRNATLLAKILPFRKPKVTVLQEAGSMNESTSNTWWVNSGGYLFSSNGIFETNQGELPMTDKWYQAYKKNNPIDTDDGTHPQNIFRLVTRQSYENYRQEVYFRITKQNLSASDQRDAWSGLLLFNRYVDGDNLYYAGIRVDGTAVIKSKKKGLYATLAQVPVFSGTYDRSNNPTLLPVGTWIGLRSEVQTLPDDSVSIALYIDKDGTGNWTLATKAIDKKDPVLGSQHAGIRTDFMDVQFKGYRIQGI